MSDSMQEYLLFKGMAERLAVEVKRMLGELDAKDREIAKLRAELTKLKITAVDP